jgi:hypothetical protein
MTEEQLRILDLALFDLSMDSGVIWSGEFMAEVAAALRALLDEVAALKARDPLAEMWRELSEYQPMADRDGHGESWRTMCRERTEESAWAAARAASWDAEDASWAAADAARNAAWAAEADEKSAYSVAKASSAVAEIRRAKEER